MRGNKPTRKDASTHRCVVALGVQACNSVQLATARLPCSVQACVLPGCPGCARSAPACHCAWQTALYCRRLPPCLAPACLTVSFPSPPRSWSPYLLLPTLVLALAMVERGLQVRGVLEQRFHRSQPARPPLATCPASGSLGFILPIPSRCPPIAPHTNCPPLSTLACSTGRCQLLAEQLDR